MIAVSTEVMSDTERTGEGEAKAPNLGEWPHLET